MEAARRVSGLRPQQAFQENQVKPAAEFPTHLPETRDLLETEPLMETDRCRVFGVDAAQDHVFSEAGCAGQ